MANSMAKPFTRMRNRVLMDMRMTGKVDPAQLELPTEPRMQGMSASIKPPVSTALAPQWHKQFMAGLKTQGRPGLSNTGPRRPGQ